MIAGVFLVLYSTLSNLFPQIGFIFSLVLFAAVPWIVVRALAFNARNSALRNIRFGFSGRVKDADKAFALWPILVLITLGILAPYAYYRQRKFIVENSRYETTRFALTATARDYYRLFLSASVPFIISVCLVASVIFFLPLLAVPAVCFFYDNGAVTVENSVDGCRILSLSRFTTKVSPRLADTPRYFHFPDGEKFETQDNPTVDRIAKRFAGARWTDWLHQLESRWRFALIALAAMLLFVWGGITYGVPIAASGIAHRLPPSILHAAGEHTLGILDKSVMRKSDLDLLT